MQLLEKKERKFCMSSNNEELRKKRYGQFFSGQRVSDLLVQMIPEYAYMQDVVDPMVGMGDMIKAVLRKNPKCVGILGIDIDADAISNCKKTLQNSRFVCEDAFRSKHLVNKNGWNLVITNPPYVRYQLMNSNDNTGLPTAEEVRRNLILFIEKNKYICEQEKKLLLSIAKNYSGLSDLAVPSWILCSALVRNGGYLAMVVPETWLNRDYALPIHYMLLKCYDIAYIARDTESVWFDNASIRTCLVVARKKDNICNLKDNSGMTRYLEIGAKLMGNDSLVQHLIYKQKEGYVGFKEVLNSGENIELDGFSARNIKTKLLFTKLMSSVSTYSWIDEEDKEQVESIHILPEELMDILDERTQLFSLEEIGWKIGQGLRTGANDFFYGELVDRDKKENLVKVNTRKWNGTQIHINQSHIRIVLQNRSEVSGLCVEKEKLSKCIFYIENECTANDFKLLSKSAKPFFSLLETDLQNYIESADNYINEKTKKKFRDLSAVLPNEKKDNTGFKRFWYMLPKLQERHMPDLCIPRLCGNSVECLYLKNISKNRILVDANFITLWNNKPTEHAYIFALLNSSWFKCYMEIIGTRMGGGALKIEASHLKQVLFPEISNKSKHALGKLAIRLMEEADDKEVIIKQIDNVIFSDYNGLEKKKIVKSLNLLLKKKMSERGIYE